MRNIVKSTVLIAAVMCALLPSYAAESAQYGKNLTQVFVGGRTADGTFEDYMTDGDDSWKREAIPFNGTVFFDEGSSGDRTLVAEITDEEARNGKNSLKFDMDALARCSTNSDKSARLILQKNINYKKPGITYYYEAWVKLRDETKAQLLDENLLSEFSYPAMIRLDDYGNNGKYTNDKAFAHSDGEKDENGWRKISITKKCIDTDGVLKIGPSVYNLRAEGEGLGVIYYDDISAYALPDSMRAECAKKIYDPDEAPLLSDIKVYGCDAAGNEEEFVDYSNIKYSVESGEAEIKEVKYDKLSVNMTRYELRVNGQVLDTPPKELELLFHLASNPNRVYTRDQLLDEVWGFEYYGDSRTIDVHVKRLREKLEGVSDKWALKTVWGVGYKFEVAETPHE